ncbi:MAG: glycosyltransferase family 39 protein [Candidatus Altiarchaeota archaeon]
MEYPYITFGDNYFALTQSLVDTGDLNLNEYLTYPVGSWQRCCLSMGSDGNAYSRFSPGFSYAMAPFYVLSGLRGIPLASVLFSTLTVLYLFLLCRLFVDEKTALITSLVFAFCTSIYTYSQVSLSESLLGLLLIASVYYMADFRKAGRTESMVLSGYFFGFLVFTKISLSVLAVIYLLGLRSSAKNLSYFAVGASVFLAILFSYDALLFGSPLQTGYSSVMFDSESGLQGPQDTRALFSFDVSFVRHVALILVALIVTQPVILFSFYGLLKNRNALEIIMISWISLLLVLFYSFWHNPFGTVSWSPRYHYPLIPLLSLPFSMVFDDSLKSRRYLLLLVTTISLMLTVLSLNFASWGYFSLLSESLF